jgi:hypothetical protein
MKPEGKSRQGLGPDHWHFAPADDELWVAKTEPLLDRLPTNSSLTD